jgi:hypothetical protein
LHSRLNKRKISLSFLLTGCTGRKLFRGADCLLTGEIGMAVVGPDTPASSEMRLQGQYYQNQIAATEKNPGHDFKSDLPAGKHVGSMKPWPIRCILALFSETI